VALRLQDLPHYTYDDYKIWEGRWELIGGMAFEEVYKLENGFSRLQGESTDEKFIFDLSECKIEFNFNNVFEG